MKKICQWLCPKKKKIEGPYDVHEETFEMDEHIGDIQAPQRLTEPTGRQSQISSSSQKQQSGQSIISSVMQENMNSSQEDEMKFMQSKNKIQKSEEKIEKIDQTQINVANNGKKPQLNAQSVTEGKQIVQQKPKPKYNILNSTIKKKKFNPQDYYFKQQENKFRIKGVDSIKGQQFNIENCNNGTYFIFDVTANIYIDDCENCFIFAAPVQSSIFVRSCKNMIIVAAVGQFRTYNCHNSHFSIYCKSQPVIQSSSGIHFSSFQSPQYPQLKDQFFQAKLEPLNNNWSQIHNFTKKEGQTHYQLDKKPQHKYNIDWQRAFKEANLEQTKPNQQIVPFIQGVLELGQPISRALLIFGKEESQHQQKILNWIKQNNILLLKASKSKIGNQKYSTIALLIHYNQQKQLDWNEVGNPTMIIEQQEVKQNENKYFVNFKDER